MDDVDLWRRFTHQQISRDEWNHSLHIRTAFLHVCRFDLDEAHLRMRAGIIRLNHAHGVGEGVARGYSETLTRVWLILVQAQSCLGTPASSDELPEMCPDLMDRELPLKHYSRELLYSPRARSIFVEPDLKPLPGG